MLLTFVVGSLFAPASHYAYMLFSEAYGMGGHAEHQMDHQEDMHSMHNSTHVVDVGHLKANDAGKEHIECEYADLFATFAAANLPAASSVEAPALKQVLMEKPVEAPQVLHFSPFNQRGPPGLSYIA